MVWHLLACSRVQSTVTGDWATSYSYTLLWPSSAVKGNWACSITGKTLYLRCYDIWLTLLHSENTRFIFSLSLICNSMMKNLRSLTFPVAWYNEVSKYPYGSTWHSWHSKSLYCHLSFLFVIAWWSICAVWHSQLPGIMRWVNIPMAVA